jgi:hypothetical protein
LDLPGDVVLVSYENVFVVKDYVVAGGVLSLFEFLTSILAELFGLLQFTFEPFNTIVRKDPTRAGP